MVCGSDVLIAVVTSKPSKRMHGSEFNSHIFKPTTDVVNIARERPSYPSIRQGRNIPFRFRFHPLPMHVLDTPPARSKSATFYGRDSICEAPPFRAARSLASTRPQISGVSVDSIITHQ
jgi:hypothetical protein